MANYQQILDVINQNIKQNGNEEITGDVMNSVLKLLLDFINKQTKDYKGYNGFITENTRPNNVRSGYWLANSGFYPNFGVEVSENHLGVVYWNEDRYIADEIELINEEVINEYLNNKVVHLYGDEVIDGNKEFTSPILNPIVPTNNNHLANKKYVDETIDTKAVQRIDTEENWINDESILYAGEIALVEKNGKLFNVKFGDGTKKFSELPYMYKGGFDGFVTKSTDPNTLIDGFYFAKEYGIYTNLGNLLVKENSVTIIQKSGNNFSIASEIDIPYIDRYDNPVQFTIKDALFEPNYQADKNKIKWNNFNLIHFGIDENIKEWQVQAGAFTVPNDLSYIVYIKCSRTDNQATIDISTENKQPIQDDYYYFTLGVLNSPEAGSNSRTLSLLQGITTISGEYIKTGRISSNDGSTYFDLDNGEFKGKFTFTNGESVEEAITNQEIYIEYSQNGIDWHSTFQYDDVFMRQKKGDGAWSNAIRIVGIQGIKGDKGADGQTQYVHIRYSANSNGSSMTTTPQANTAYIGIVTTTSSVAPTSNTSYTWSLIKGEQGVPGIPGSDGSSLFTWVKYADTPTSGMSDYPDNKLYIGLAYNKVTATESNNYEDYSWSLMPQNIEIGGRNLILNSANIHLDGNDYQGSDNSELGVIKINSSENWNCRGWIELSANPKVGDYQTYSIELNPTAELNVTFNYAPYFPHNNFIKTEHIPANVWTKVFVTGEIISTTTDPFLIGMEGSNSAGVNLRYRNIKIERGNKATDWTPAPEDVESSIEQAKQNSINASKAYADAQDELKRIQTQAYADGKVTAVEQRAIDDATAKAEAAKLYAKVQDDLLRVQLEAYADGVVTAEEQERIQQMQDNLVAAKAYADAQDNLAKIASNAYADGIVDEEEARAIADATAKMEAAKAHAQGLVNSIQIGGRNLILNSANIHMDGNDYQGSDNSELGVIKINSSENWNCRDWIELSANPKVGDYQTFSIELNPTTELNVTFNYAPYFPHNNFIKTEHIPANVWTKVFVTGEIISTTTSPFLIGMEGSNSAGVNLRYRNIKIERGNKATDWTPAPEDVDNAINDVKVKAENALSQLTSIANDNILSPSEKQQVSNEWNRIKSEYTSNYSLAINNGISTTDYTNSYNDLYNYITPLLVDISVDSPIVGDVFRTKFKAYYDQNIALIVAINDKLLSGISANTGAINRINQVTSFLNTTVNGNVIGTGVLMVGSETQSNAGISGLNEAGSKSVRLWAGGTAQNRDKANWQILDDGTMQFFHPNGNIAFRFGLSNGKFIMDGYHEQGMKLWELSPNRGLVNVAYIPESWNTTPMININQSSSTLNVANAKTAVVNLMSIVLVNNFRRYIASSNYTSFEYQNGTHPDNAQYANLIGYKTVNNSRTSNIPNGWYGLEVGEIDMDYEPSNGELPPIKTIVYFLYYIENGKVTKNQSIQFTDRDIANK